MTTKCAYITIHVDLDEGKTFEDVKAEIDNLELSSGDIVDVHVEDRDKLSLDEEFEKAEREYTTAHERA